MGALVAATVIACSSDDEPLPTAVPTTASQPTAAPELTEVTTTGPAAGSGAMSDLVIPLGELNDSRQTGIASF